MLADHLSPLTWQWRSQKGAERQENRDACGLFANAVTTFAVVMDASAQGENGQDFNMFWMTQVIQALAQHPSGPTVEQVLAHMRTAQRMLRPPRFLLETACFCALLIRHDLGRAWILACGDCRIGLEKNGQDIAWLSPVHSQANMLGEAFTLEHALSDARHTVTRCLKVKRFTAPEVLEAPFDPASTWLLATDGYWVDQLTGQLGDPHFADDRSLLKLGRSVTPLHASDSDNLRVVGALHTPASCMHSLGISSQNWLSHANQPKR